MRRILEAIAAILLPPACREEVLGDLHERYRSLLQYIVEALHTITLVIVSRIRRTTDPAIVLIRAFALYLSFLCAARIGGGDFLFDRWALISLAIPCAVALLWLTLDDAWATTSPRSAFSAARGRVVALLWALTSQAAPPSTMLYGCLFSLLLLSAIRALEHTRPRIG